MDLDLHEVFERLNDDFLKFELIANPRCQRPDLNAFLLLNELVPSNEDIVASASHDIIYLSVDIEAFAQVVTEEQILELIRCGVMYDSSYDCLSMFV